ncbi:MAG: hypothetical protein AAF702_04040 [Chloroflexota bacterium]
MYDTYVIGGVDRVSVPAEVSHRIRQRMLGLYLPHKVPARFAWYLIRNTPALRHLRWISYHANGPSQRHDGLDWEKWTCEVAQELSLGKVLAAFYFPPQINRKQCSVLLFDKTDEPIAFARLAWGAQEIKQSMREQRGLAFFQSYDFQTFEAPVFLFQGQFEGTHYVLYSPIPLIAKRAPGFWNEIYQQAWAEMVRLTEKSVMLNNLHWWDSKTFSDCTWNTVVARLKSLLANRGARCSAAHGDFTPWNARIISNRLLLFDWENFEHEAPLFLDPFYFVLSHSVLVKNQRSYSAIYSHIIDTLSLSVIQPDEADILLTLVYLKIHLQNPLLIRIIDGLVPCAIKWANRHGL